MKRETILSLLLRMLCMGACVIGLAPWACARPVEFRLEFVGAELLGYYGDNLRVLQRMDTLLKYVGGSSGVDSVVMESGYLPGESGTYLGSSMARGRLSQMGEYLQRRVEYYGYSPLPVQQRTRRYPASDTDPREVTAVSIIFFLNENNPQGPYPAVRESSAAMTARHTVFPAAAPRPRPMPERAAVYSRPERQQKYSASADESYAVGLGTNLLYLGVLVPNLEAEFYFARRFSIRLQWMYADWELGTASDGDANFWSLDRYGAELRYWFRGDGSFTGHALGIYGSGGQFDLKKKGRTGHTGSYIAGGLRYGYSVSLNPSRSLVMSFGVEAGYLRLDYRDYVFSNGKFYREGDKLRNYWGPTGAEVTLTWRFGRP